MKGRNHGRRYTFSEKREILDYLENHTYKEACTKYGISEPTLSRWRQALKSERKKNRAKLTITLPKFWLEFLNEQITLDIWKDHSDAILNTIRYYLRHQKSIHHAESKYLEDVKELIPNLLKLNPNIDSLLLSSSNEVIYKTKRWKSTEGILDLIENWKKASSGKLKEFEFQNETYYIRDISVKHLVGVKKSQRSGYLLGLKRKLTENDVYIFAKAKETEDSSLLLAMNTLKRTAMGVLPTISEELLDKSFKVTKEIPSRDLKTILQRRKDYIEKSQEIISEDARILIEEQTSGLNRLNSRLREQFGDSIVDELFIRKTEHKVANNSQKIPPRDEKRTREYWLKEKERIFKIKMHPALMRVATRVNMPLNLEEKEVLDALEKQIGKMIERITADPEQETCKAELLFLRSFPWEKLPWMQPNADFPAHKFPCHYTAFNGEIILLSLFDMGLSELPSEISNLKNLTYLCLNSNNITELPKTFSKLKSLENIILDNNQFTKVPDSLIELSKLQNLYMRNNKISQIPVALTQHYEWKLGGLYPPYLEFSGNQIEHSSLSKEQLELESKLVLMI